jgi:hypothetical protein
VKIRVTNPIVTVATAIGRCLVMFLWIVISWIGNDFGTLSEQSLLVFSMTLVVLGMQTIFTSFFMSIVGMHGRDGR